MKFTRLRLTGFKSFCDPTDLYLEPGLTGVVGPNGCGKSNLVEALRWVMGESSYKAMRAAGMDEVIFSGSANRPGRNSAEVTVFLDNSDRTAPAALNNADLLEVTRRIEREAGSVYRVNGREVRARDVQLLFADASTGAHSPALVRQGQIGELIAAKPVQRRALLEEAAGISGLHSRRHEAELRLRAAEQNLERVDDVVAQVEQQLDTLKRQARLATRYRNISGDIRKAEATLYHIRWVKARYSEKEAEASQGKLIAQLADATHLERQTAQRLATAEERVEPLRNAEASAAAALQRLTLLRQQLDDEMRRADVRRAELEDRQKQIVADCGRERDLMSEADALIAQYAQEQSELDREAANEQEAAEAARNNAERVRTRLEAAEQTARSAADTLARLRADRTQAERSAADAAGRAERLEQRIGDIDGELADIEAELQADETVAERTSELEAAKAQSSRAEERALAAEQAVADRQDALDAVRPALAEIEAKVSSLDAEAATLARVLNADGETLWPAIVDALTVSSGYETALGAALGSDLDASSDSGASLYWSEPGDGSTDPALPEDAEPLSRYVTGPDLLARRLAQIGLVELDAGFRLMRHLKPGQRLVTRDGDLWRWDGFVVAADAPTAAAQRLSQRNRLRELDGEIAAARSRRDEMHASSATLAERLDNARTAEREARETWRGAQRQIATAQTTLDAAQATSTRLTARKSALEDTRARLAGDREEAEAAAGTANKALAETGDEAAAQQAADDAQKALSELRASAEQARVTLGGFENATRLRQNRLQQIARDAESWRRRKADAATQLETLERRRHEIAEQLKTLNATPDSFAARRNALDEDIAAAEADHRTASDRMTEAQTGHREADKAARAAADALSHAREELARVEERMKGFIAQRRQIEETIQENLDIPAAKTAEIAGLGPEAPLPDADAVERKLDRLKSERERLGGVNLGAEREAETIREKLETMVNDREDLIAAIAKLRSGISSLNREGRARLTDAFDRVNAHFQDLFISLFGGGNAQLQFVESDDPLDAGLEILARPPGKKPQTMTLLSGGEQALTALSLIFAVFLTNPAPICVLDEVDAPLDDANVDRFCTLLETMRARTDTRFVTITHNPITMSRVDRLFGVTMAERGVSQLVSVDLKTAHEVAEAG